MLAFAMRFDDPTRADRWASITPSAKEPGRWQFTLHDAEGPYHDTQRDTPEEAIDHALSERLIPLDVIGCDADQGLQLLRQVENQRRAEREEWDQFLAEVEAEEAAKRATIARKAGTVIGVLIAVAGTTAIMGALALRWSQWRSDRA